MPDKMSELGSRLPPPVNAIELSWAGSSSQITGEETATIWSETMICGFEQESAGWAEETLCWAEPKGLIATA